MQYFFKWVLAVLYVTIGVFVDFFFFGVAVGSLSLLRHVQYMICKAHEALWDLSELQALCKCETTVFVSIVTLQTLHFIQEIS